MLKIMRDKWRRIEWRECVAVAVVLIAMVWIAAAFLQSLEPQATELLPLQKEAPSAADYGAFGEQGMGTRTLIALWALVGVCASMIIHALALALRQRRKDWGIVKG